VKLKRASWVAGAACAALAFGLVPAGSSNPAGLGLGPSPAMAQNLGERTVSGSVVDQSSALVSGATVFLKNLKNKTIRSYTSDANGKYQFAQVYMNDDYELWAEKGGLKSATKTVSSWDTRTEFVAELKLK
jgi:hypothetical protein